MTSSGLGRAVERLVDEHLADEPFSGVVQLRESGDTVYASAFGLANRADAVPNTMATRFGTASGTKAFTAVAVCQLIEAGALSADTRLADVVGVPLPYFDDDITIHHLLTHTSGAPDYFDEEELDPQADFGAVFQDLPVYRVRTPADVLPLFQNEPMKFPSGQRFSYNNGGYVLLGLAIEGVSGMAYADFVERHVFDRAGMKDSGFFELDKLPANTATGYLDNRRTNIYEIPIKGMPDGGAFVTAPDMATFWDALLGNALIGKHMTSTLLHPHEAVNPKVPDSFYGYGMWVFADNSGTSRYSISGADPGVACVSVRFVHEAVDLTILGNTGSDAWPLFSKLKQMIEGKK